MISKWQTKYSGSLCGKRSQAVSFIEGLKNVTLKYQDPILNWWTEYFIDLLNPVDATLTTFTRNKLGKIFR